MAEIYQKMAYDIQRGMDKLFEAQKELIERYKAEGRKKEIQSEIKKLKKNLSLKKPIFRMTLLSYGRVQGAVSFRYENLSGICLAQQRDDSRYYS